jgi:hypothetical protein
MSTPEAFRGTGRFEVRRCLGSGGFGTVYEALDRKRNAAVALKVLRGASARDIYRFKHEFRGLQGITHPNLVTLYELGSEGDQWFFSMELVRGLDFFAHVGGDTEVDPFTPPTPDPRDAPTAVTGVHARALESTLESPVAEGPAPPPRRAPPLSVPRLVGALRQLCHGLLALHAAGTVHRDIKPANVLCTREGRVVVLDFGIARELSPERGESTHHFAGTPRYMAPEQALELPVTAAADWYSVGVLLYEALTGALPFEGSDLVVLRQKMDRDPQPPSRLRPEIPAALDALTVRLLDRRPERRPTGEEILACLAAVEAELGASADAPASALRARPREGPFLGREAHLAALAAAYEQSREGEAVVVLCHGGSGAGKSALCRRFLQEIGDRDERAVVLAGRCYEHEDVPFKALDGVIDALSRFLGRRAPAEALAILPRDAAALARVFPVLLQVTAVRDAPARRIADDLEVRKAAFAALRELLLRLSDRRPVVIHVDDLQWGDPDGVALLLELVRPPAAPPLLVVLSYRAEEEASSEALQLLRRGLSGDPGRGLAVRELPVDELSPGDAEALARALLPEEARGRAAAIAAETGGNPFFVTELSRSLAEPGPSAAPDVATLDAVLRARAALLPEATRRLLEAVAVAGQPVARAVAAAAAYGDAPTGDEPQAIAELRAGRLIRVRHTASRQGAREDLLPYHDRVREAVVAGLAPEALAAHHLGLARALEGATHAEPERLVFHFQRGGDAGGAARHAVQASAQAVATLAFHQAARLCRVALAAGVLSAEETRVVEARLAHALARGGHPREAGEAYLALVDREAPETALLRRRQAAEQFFTGGYLPEGLGVVRQLLAAVGLRAPGSVLELVLTLIVFRLLLALRGQAYRERAEADVPAQDLLRIGACEAVGAAATSDPLLSSTFRLRGLWYALAAGEPRRISRGLANEALILAAFRAPAARIADRLSRATALAERLGDPYTLGHAVTNAGHIANLAGRWEESSALMRRARDILETECTEVGADVDSANLILMYNLRFMGSIRALTQELPPLLEAARERGKQSQEVILRLIAGFLLPLCDDDPDRAEEGARAAELRLEGQAWNLQHVFLLEVRILILLYRGEGAAAWALLAENERALARSGQLNLEFFEMVWHDLRGLTALSSGGAPPRIAERAAARLCRGSPLFAAPMASALRAVARRREGRREEALALLKEAEEGFAGCDMGLHTAVIRLRRGAWLGGEEGERVAAPGRAFLREQGIKSPERLGRLVLPDDRG